LSDTIGTSKGTGFGQMNPVRCQVFSKLIRHYRRKLRAVILAKGGSKE